MIGFNNNCTFPSLTNCIRYLSAVRDGKSAEKNVEDSNLKVLLNRSAEPLDRIAISPLECYMVQRNVTSGSR